MNANTVADLLAETLEVATAGLVDPAADPPARRYVAHGDPAWDCDQLTVHLVRIQPVLIESRAETCTVIPQATIAIVLLRCVTALEADGVPNAQLLNTENTQLAIDGPAMFKHFTRQWATGAFPSGHACKALKWRNLLPLAPQGAYAGWRIEYDLKLV